MKKFSFKSEFQELTIDFEIGEDVFDNVLVVENNSELIEGSLTYINLLKNILRNEDRKLEIIKSFKDNLKPDDIVKYTNEILEALQGK